MLLNKFFAVFVVILLCCLSIAIAEEAQAADGGTVDTMPDGGLHWSYPPPDPTPAPPPAPPTPPTPECQNGETRQCEVCTVEGGSRVIREGDTITVYGTETCVNNRWGSCTTTDTRCDDDDGDDDDDDDDDGGTDWLSTIGSILGGLGGIGGLIALLSMLGGNEDDESFWDKYGDIITGAAIGVGGFFLGKALWKWIKGDPTAATAADSEEEKKTEEEKKAEEKKAAENKVNEGSQPLSSMIAQNATALNDMINKGIETRGNKYKDLQGVCSDMFKQKLEELREEHITTVTKDTAAPPGMAMAKPLPEGVQIAMYGDPSGQSPSISYENDRTIPKGELSSSIARGSVSGGFPCFNYNEKSKGKCDMPDPSAQNIGERLFGAVIVANNIDKITYNWLNRSNAQVNRTNNKTEEYKKEKGTPALQSVIRSKAAVAFIITDFSMADIFILEHIKIKLEDPKVKWDTALTTQYTTCSAAVIKSNLSTFNTAVVAEQLTIDFNGTKKSNDAKLKEGITESIAAVNAVKAACTITQDADLVQSVNQMAEAAPLMMEAENFAMAYEEYWFEFTKNYQKTDEDYKMACDDANKAKTDQASANTGATAPPTGTSGSGTAPASAEQPASGSTGCTPANVNKGVDEKKEIIGNCFCNFRDGSPEDGRWLCDTEDKETAEMIQKESWKQR